MIVWALTLTEDEETRANKQAVEYAFVACRRRCVTLFSRDATFVSFAKRFNDDL